MMLLNEALSDELEAINGIYGEGTLVLVSVQHDHTRVQLLLPSSIHDGDDEVFDHQTREWLPVRKAIPTVKNTVIEIDFAANYPAAIPKIRGIGAKMHEYRDQSLWRVHVLLFSVLQTAFVPGHVCMFDWLDLTLPLVASLSTDGLDLLKVKWLMPHLDIDEKMWRWTFSKSVDMDKAFNPVSCAVCLDEAFAFSMVDLPCEHFFCIDCFQNGWNVFADLNEPFACCLKRIPMEVIKQFAEMTDLAAKKYSRMLAERSTRNPFFCVHTTCGELIGSLDDLKKGTYLTRAQCHHCMRYSCVYCRQQGHGGDCQIGEFEIFMKLHDIRRCGWCGTAIEKNGGCSHVVCRNCGAHHTWQSDGGFVPWD